MRVANIPGVMRSTHLRHVLKQLTLLGNFGRFTICIGFLALIGGSAEARDPGGRSGRLRLRRDQPVVKLRLPNRGEKLRQKTLSSQVTFKSFPTNASRRWAPRWRPLSTPQNVRRTTRMAHVFGDAIGSAAQHPARSRMYRGALKGQRGLNEKTERRAQEAVTHLPKPLASAVQAIKRSGKTGVAALDADGTLWGGDVGEGFFAWMLKNRYYPKAAIPKLTHAWRGYKAGTFNGELMYELMVTGMAGMREKDVERYANTYFRRHRHRIYRPMAHLVRALRKIDVEPWVVSGSPFWVVAAGAKYFGIPKSRVIGLSVDVDERGRLTGKVVRPVPWKWGKAKRIFRDIGKTPLVVAGNSSGDVEMLRIASALKLVINPGPKVLKAAERNHWSVQLYSETHELGEAVRQLTARSTRAKPCSP